MKYTQNQMANTTDDRKTKARLEDSVIELKALISACKASTGMIPFYQEDLTLAEYYLEIGFYV
jgi:hypothetical protein